MASEFLKRMAAQEQLQKLQSPAVVNTPEEGAADSRPQVQPSLFLQRMAAQEKAQAAQKDEAVPTSFVGTGAETQTTESQPSAFLQYMVEQEKQKEKETEAFKTKIGYDEVKGLKGFQRYLSDRGGKQYTEGYDGTEPTEKWSAEQKNIYGYLYVTSPIEAGNYARQVNASIENGEEKAAYNIKMNYYDGLAGAADFKEKSSYVPQEQKARSVWSLLMDDYSDEASGWEDPLYEAINGNEEAKAYLHLQGRNYYGSDAGALARIYGAVTEGKTEAKQMTERELATFNYLYATEGKGAAREYYNFIRSELYARQRKADEEYWKEYADRDPVGSSAFSVAVSPLKGLSYLGQVADFIDDGKIDQNAGYNKFANTPTVIRSKVSKKIEESGNWGKVGSFAYQTGMSMADNLLNTALGGNNQTIVLAIMGSGAAADCVIAAKDRGLSDKQAFALGTIAGVAEAGIESMNFETIFNADLLKQGIVKYILKNGSAEGMEEVATSIANTIADLVIAQDKSTLMQSINEYKKHYSESEAIARVIGDQALQLLTDFAGGFVSGGVMSGGTATINTIGTNKLGDALGQLDLSDEDVQAFIDTGLESGENTTAHQIAVELQEKLKKGKKLSNNDIARLWQANMQAVDEEQDTSDQADQQEQTAGVRLPTADESVLKDAAAQDQQENVTQNPVTVTENISVAEQLRRQNENGGINNVNTQGQNAGLTAAGNAVTTAQTGTGLLLRGGQRFDGAGTAEQAGNMAGRAGQAAQGAKAAQWNKATIDRRNRIRSLRLIKISSAELGLQSGTETKNIQLVPQEHWDAEMNAVAERVYQETGRKVSFVMGAIQVKGKDGHVRNANGVISGDNIVVRADHIRLSMQQIADHESYHAYVADKPSLNRTLRRYITERYSKEGFTAVMKKYTDALDGVYNMADGISGEEFAALQERVLEEVLADAYAGINAFGANADQFTAAVQEAMEQQGFTRYQMQENGVRETTGPPKGETMEKENTAADGGEWFSYIGETEDGIEVYETSKKVQNLSWKERKKRFLQIMRNEYRGRTAKFVRNGHAYYATFDYRDVSKNIYGDNESDDNGRDAKIKVGADGNIFELVEHSKYNGSEPESGKNTKIHRGVNYWDYFIKTVQIDGGVFDLTANVRKKSDGQYVYAIEMHENKEIEPSSPGGSQKSGLSGVPNSSGDIIQDESFDVKKKTKEILSDEEFQAKYGLKLRAVDEIGKGADSQAVENAESFSIDSAGDELSERQIEYFESSKVRDGDGNLKVMYHGSPETFTVFSKSKARSGGTYGKGFYFTDSDAHASQYGNAYKVYLNITHPLQNGTKDITKQQLRRFVEAIAENEDYGIDNYGYGATVDSVTNDVFGKSDFGMLLDINAACIGNMVEAIQIFNEVNGTEYDGIIAPTETVAFYPEQIKRTDNRNPTTDPDIRYSVDDFEDQGFASVQAQMDAQRKGRDASYMDAVRNEDMQTAKRMVDDYAIEQGFAVDEDGAPDLLFHGTDSFGFTNIDTSESDDGISFWATPNIGVAGSYYKDSSYRVREIGKEKVSPRGEKLGYASSMEKAVNAARPFSAELNQDLSKAKFAKEADVMKKARKPMQKAVRAAEVVLDGNFPNDIKKIARNILSAADQGTYEAWGKAVNSDKWKQYSEATGLRFWELDLGDKFNPDKSDISKVTQVDPDIFRMMYHIGDVLDAISSDDFGTLKGETITKQDIIDSYNELVSEKGVYGFYHKESNPFVYDCNGSAWNKIEVPEEARGYFNKDVTSTRELAAWAFENGYDAIKLDNVVDVGGYALKEARSPATVWAFKNPKAQIKSADPVTYDDKGNAIPLSQRFNTKNDDIRYSVDDDSENDFASVQAAMNAQSKDWSEMYLRDQLGDEGYEQYRAWEKKQAEQKKQQSKERTKERTAAIRNARKSATQPVAESKPIEAKKELRSHMLSLFSIPEGSRAELGAVIDGYADRLLKNGTLTEEDREHFFDRMYDAGVMTVPAEDYFSDARDLLKGGRVYVSDRLRQEFGDDWNDFRRRAFGCGIYFTNDRNASGVDSWNQELAQDLPGLFDSEETDLRSVLERIVEVAEEGRDDQMSLREYTAMLAGQEHVSERELLDGIERQMEEALRTFAKQAKLEVKLRDRTGRQIAKERAEHVEMDRRQRDRKELRELQEKTLKSLQWLNKNRNRAPEELRERFEEVLGDIDLYAIGAANEMRWSDRYNATWKDLAQMYKDAMKNDPNFLPSKELEMIVSRLDGEKIADMDLGALNDLYKAAVGLRTEFYNRNNVISDEMNRLFAEVYTDAKGEIENAPGSYTGKKIDKLMNLEQLTPMNVLQRMGGWDPNGAFYSMAKQLEKGERDMRAYSVKAKRMLQTFLTEHADFVKKADGQGKDAVWYEIEVPELLQLGMGDKPIFGDTVKVYMTPAQKVHMYLESKNVDNLRHMTGGRTFADKKLYSEGKRQEAFAQGKTVRLAPETVKAIVSDLTEEEMELARLLEQYYNSFATQEINRVSNVLYGYDKAMGKNYAPIYTNRNYTKAEFGVFDQTAEGVGNLKGRQYAVNPSYNIGAFDAFERHVDQTARFVGMAIPARNWTTLMNWREKNNSTGDVITHKWGEEGKKYITDLVTTLQAGGDSKNVSDRNWLDNLQSTYITAIFGANPSIVLKQLGSIPLAGAYLDAKNLPSPAQVMRIDRSLIAKYTQDLEWRSMGYSMPETKFLKDNPNWTQTNKFYGFVFGGDAITAMDSWAASVLWPWAENKVRREYPDLEVGSAQQVQNGQSPFYQKVAELFEDAVARSQSTSDEIHQSLLRKSKNPLTRAFTMFRSDSAQTYNTLRQKIGEARYYARTGATDQVKRAASRAVGGAFAAMLINALWGEAINFLMALWKNKGKKYRDEEEELTAESVLGEMVSGMLGSFAGVVTGGEEIFEFIGNLLTGEKIYDIETPGMEQLNDLIETFSNSGGTMREIISGAVNVAENDGDLGKYFSDNSGDILGAVKQLAEKIVMYIPGLPASGFPASNIEAYILGAVKWISPELGTAYDDLFENVDKSKLSGLEGDALRSRAGRILSDRGVTDSDETVEELASLYESGYKSAIPSDTPSSVTVEGEKRTLSTYQQQVYEKTWSGIVAEVLDAMLEESGYKNANAEERSKILGRLYSYAAEKAKAEVFSDYKISSAAKDVDELKGKESLAPEHFLTDDYRDLVDAGLDGDEAYDLMEEIENAREEAGDEGLASVDKWRICVDMFQNSTDQLAALSMVMTSAQFEKAEMANEFGVNPKSYVAFYEIRKSYDADGNGSYTQAEIKNAIDSMGNRCTKEQKAVLWQLATGAKSAKNNPYSTEIGQKIVDAKQAAKDAEAELPKLILGGN